MSNVPSWYGEKLPEGVIPPESYEDAIAFFGWHGRYLKGETPFAGWEAQMVAVRLPELLHFAGAPVATVRVHPKVEAWAAAALAEIHDHGLWYLLDPYGGSYNFRLQRAGGRLSAHCFGAGFDFDPEGNPYHLRVAFDHDGGPANQSLDARGRVARFASDPRGAECVRILESWGWFWGGRFIANPDPMHWQWGTGW